MANHSKITSYTSFYFVVAKNFSHALDKNVIKPDILLSQADSIQFNKIKI